MSGLTRPVDGENAAASWPQSVYAALGNGYPVQPPAYTVYYNTTTSEYEARNGMDGTIDVNGASANTVIQAAYDALSVGQTLFIKGKGSDITGITGLTFDTLGTCVVGEGHETVLAGNPAADLITVSAQQVTLANFQVDGYGSANPTSGIKVTASKCVMHDVQVKGVATAPGVWFNTAGSSASLYSPIIINCLTGIQMDAASNNISLFGGAITTNVVNATLVNIDGGDTLKVYGTDFEGIVATTTGIYVNYANSAMALFAPRFETLSKGIEWNSGSYDSVYAPSFATVTTPITAKPATSAVYDGWGYITRNSGSSSIDSGTAFKVVAHGLSVTPAAEDFTIIGKENPFNDVGTIFVNNIGAVNFTVNVENDPGVTNWDFGWRVDASK